MSLCSADWPPPAEFFKSGPIGFTYVVQLWFRYYLHEFIIRRMAELESRANVLQLDHQKPNYARYGDHLVSGGHFNIRETGLPHLEGNCITGGGNGEYRYMADVALMNLPLDVSEMTVDWVSSTTDKLFRNLSQSQRRLLHLIHVEELSWNEIAASFDSEPHVMKRHLKEIMQYLKGHATFQKTV